MDDVLRSDVDMVDMVRSQVARLEKLLRNGPEPLERAVEPTADRTVRSWV